ncbi:ABC transporter ATP-binding protein [Candidatus Daviesbacteria bacterium]|nr:ABC transporter ATP-binding protein [Candidatus Daviesbacteria bacterium]
MEKETSDILVGIKRSWNMLDKGEKLYLVIASSLMLITGILTNLPAVILGRFIDQIAKQTSFNFESALPFIILVSVIILTREALTVIRKQLVHSVITQTDKKQTVKVIDQLLKTDIEFLSSYQIGSLHGRIFRSIQGLIRLIRLTFMEFLPVFFSAVAALFIALSQKPLLASMMVLVIPAGLFIISKQISSQKGVRVFLLRGKEEIDGKVVEMLSGIETIRVANTYKEEVSKIEQFAEKLRVKGIRHHLFMALFDAGKILNESIFYILVVSLAIYYASIGAISQGDILVYSILFLSIVNPLREIHRILDQAHESSINVNDLHELVTTPTDQSFKTDNLHITTKNIVLKIKNLSFAYPSNPRKVLDQINLSIQRGEKIGIVSSSGGGKTTLIRVILRLIHSYQGEVEFLGDDLKKISRKVIAQKVAYIPQKAYIFAGTFRENILYGVDRKVSSEQIIKACRMAHIYQEITKRLGGLDGIIQEGGNNLSGGQRQRVALARLILKSPKLLIFDEATSALDNTNEAIVQKNIERAFKDKTIITIAHRLTTLKNMDRILVFDKGRIVQEGAYHELAGKTGLFKNFLEQKDRIDT